MDGINEEDYNTDIWPSNHVSVRRRCPEFIRGVRIAASPPTLQQRRGNNVQCTLYTVVNVMIGVRNCFAEYFPAGVLEALQVMGASCPT